MLWARAGASGSSMDLRWGPHFFLKLAILLAGTYSGSSSHSMRYFVTSISEPGQQVPQFFYVGYVDDQEFVSYNTGTRKYLAKVPWISKVEKNDPDYWERNTLYAQGHERSFRDHLATLAEYYNQSGGLHTFQWMYGCELRNNWSKRGYYQYAYDGRDYISLDKKTLTWTAADVPAQNTKRKWDANFRDNKFKKFYLEETCIKWLQRYLNYGKETLLRTEKPEVKVTRKVDYDGMETLICRVGGFYPKEIDITWTRDGEVWMQDTFHDLVSPNSDGTYYTWWNVTVDPKEKERYKCHVEHDGLLNPVDVAWEEPDSKFGLIIGCIVGALLAIAAIAGLAVYFQKHQCGHRITSEKHQDDYKTVSASDQKFNISEEGSDKKFNSSKEEIDEGFISAEEASEKNSLNSEEPLCPSVRFVSIKAASYAGGGGDPGNVGKLVNPDPASLQIV